MTQQEILMQPQKKIALEEYKQRLSHLYGKGASE